MSISDLLVDDDPDLCRLVAARLSERGFDVTRCTSGDDALSRSSAAWSTRSSPTCAWTA
jgi:DNA-binding response OmpR family regulator